MTFPVVLKSEPSPRPPGRLYYEVAANGIFQVKDTPLYRAVTLVTRDVPGLHPSREQLWLRFRPLPIELVEEVLVFFAEVNRRFAGEAIVLLFHRAETDEWRALVPPQRIPGYRDARGRLRAYLRLDYGSVARPEGFLPFGTLHSHADLSAYSSGVDCDDERFGDGLHGVYGHFGRGLLSRSTAFVVNGRRFTVEPEQVLPDCAPPERAARADWMAQVRFEETGGWDARESWSGNGADDVPLIGVPEESDAAR